MASVVANNTFQAKFIDNEHEHLAPDPSAEQMMSCTILKIYDAETIRDEGIPLQLAGLVATHPGWLYAKVLLRDNITTMFVPFKHPEDYIYNVYGNRVQVEGRVAKIHYYNQNPQNGSLVIDRTHNEKQLPLSAIAQVFDIGFVV